jgi:hypothetical protein
MQQSLVGQGCLIIEASRSQTQQFWKDSPGRVTGPTQRPVPDNTQHSQKLTPVGLEPAIPAKASGYRPTT